MLSLLAAISCCMSTVSAIEVHGHRGARAVLPENSLAAFEYALSVGVNSLELDTGVTKDNVVVVYHDQKINRDLCQYKDGSPIEADLWVHQLTLQQIKGFDCGSKPNKWFREQQLRPGSEIPTLSEVFDLVIMSELSNADTVTFNIETKSKPEFPSAQPPPKQFAKLIIEEASKYEFLDRLILQSFDHRTLVAAKELNPMIPTAALFRRKPESWVESTRAINADIVSPRHSDLTPEDTTDIRAAGLKVIPWTANHTSDWQRLVSMGVDGIITDDPKGLIDYLNQIDFEAN